MPLEIQLYALAVEAAKLGAEGQRWITTRLRAGSVRSPRSGRRHPHQTRLSTAALQESQRRLVVRIADVLNVESFDELIDLIEETIRLPVKGIGELAVTDISLRIGARIGLEPTMVYLHSGTRIGAKILGFDGRRRTLEMSELPAEFGVLKACEVEDLLCHYRCELTRLAKGETLEPGWSGGRTSSPSGGSC